ncbi:hypothetical protein D030_4917A, partial [Vibrio parahaemolyticus AQ3810]
MFYDVSVDLGCLEFAVAEQ